MMLSGEDGTTTEYERGKNEETGQYTETLITDAAGNTYKVDSDGNITKQGTTSATVAVGNTAGYRVDFSPATEQRYGLDAYTYPAHSTNYEQATINGSQQTIHWKSVATGQTDVVIAKAQGRDKLFDEVSYRTLTGPAPRKQGQEGVEVTVVGTGAEQVTELLAVVTPADSTQTDNELTVGKLNVISYDRIIRRLVLVSVNNTATPLVSQLEGELNKIYAPAVVRWDVSSSLEGVTVELGDDGKLDDETTNLLSSYIPEMRK